MYSCSDHCGDPDSREAIYGVVFHADFGGGDGGEIVIETVVDFDVGQNHHVAVQ